MAYEPESLARIVADIDKWCEAEAADCQEPIDFICDLRERLAGLDAVLTGAGRDHD